MYFLGAADVQALLQLFMLEEIEGISFFTFDSKTLVIF